MSDRTLYVIALELGRIGSRRCHVVDPLLVAFPELIQNGDKHARRRRLRRGHLFRADNLLDELQRGHVLAFPYNDPRQHWWIVWNLTGSW